MLHLQPHLACPLCQLYQPHPLLLSYLLLNPYPLYMLLNPYPLYMLCQSSFQLLSMPLLLLTPQPLPFPPQITRCRARRDRSCPVSTAVAARDLSRPR